MSFSQYEYCLKQRNLNSNSVNIHSHRYILIYTVFLGVLNLVHVHVCWNFISATSARFCARSTAWRTTTIPSSWGHQMCLFLCILKHQLNRACHPSGHYWDYNPDALSYNQVTAAHFDGLVQERHNSSPLAMELHLSCTKPLIWRLGTWRFHLLVILKWLAATWQHDQAPG